MTEEEKEEEGGSQTKTLNRDLRLGIAIVVVVGLSLALVLVTKGWSPVGQVRGRVVGEATRVVLADAKRGVYRSGTLEADGSYSILLPPAAKEPIVVIHAAEGGAFVESGPIDIKTDPENPKVRPLTLWVTTLRIRSEEGKMVFDWGTIPSGEGLPNRPRYSILIRYTKQDGLRAEVTLLSDKPRFEMPVKELKELLRDWDSAQVDVEVELRAFDPGEQTGPMWVGRVIPWKIP